MIDTHAHLYLEQFRDDVEAVVTRAKAAGLQYVLLPNVDAGTTEALMTLVDKYPDFMIPMMGLHPCSVNTDYQQELDHIEALLKKHRFCAIGEIGIDLYWDATYMKEQERVFRVQLDWAVALGKPVVIHARDSFQEIFTILKDYKHKDLFGVFHSFTGGVEEVKQIKALGNFYFGINGIVTFKNSDLKYALSEIGIESLLLETDAPYLAPTPYRGRRNESAYLPMIRDAVANALNLKSADVAKITTGNAVRLFNLHTFI